MERNKTKKSPAMHENNQSVWVCSLIGGGIGLALTLLLALIMPMALLNTGDPNSSATAGAVVCIALGGITGSVTAANKCKDSKLLAGVLASMAEMVPIALVSVFVPGNFNLMGAILSAGALVVSATVGASVVSKVASSNKRSMKKAMKRR